MSSPSRCVVVFPRLALMTPHSRWASRSSQRAQAESREPEATSCELHPALLVVLFEQSFSIGVRHAPERHRLARQLPPVRAQSSLLSAHRLRLELTVGIANLVRIAPLSRTAALLMSTLVLSEQVCGNRAIWSGLHDRWRARRIADVIRAANNRLENPQWREVRDAEADDDGGSCIAGNNPRRV
jgi:hypothetical protein